MYSFIEKNATIKNVIIGLVLIVFFNTFLLPFLPYYLWEVKLSVNEILDLKLSYSYEVYGFFDKINIKGRSAYKMATLFIDMPYLIIYSFTYTIILFMLFKANNFRKYTWLIVIPFCVGFFDFLENIGIVSMLHFYPIELNTILLLSSTSTSLKWFFALVTFILIMLNILIYSAKKIKKND